MTIVRIAFFKEIFFFFWTGHRFSREVGNVPYDSVLTFSWKCFGDLKLQRYSFGMYSITRYFDIYVFVLFRPTIVYRHNTDRDNCRVPSTDSCPGRDEWQSRRRISRVEISRPTSPDGFRLDCADGFRDTVRLRPFSVRPFSYRPVLADRTRRRGEKRGRESKTNRRIARIITTTMRANVADTEL